MSDLYKVIYSLCEKKEITPGRLCNDLHISRSMLTDLKSGRKETLSTKTLAKIADYFHVSIDYLLGVELYFSNLGWIIPKELKKHQLTLAELAKKVGISEHDLSNYVLERKEIPDIILGKIAASFGMSIDELLNKYHQYEEVTPDFEQMVEEHKKWAPEEDDNYTSTLTEPGSKEESPISLDFIKVLTELSYENREKLLEMAYFFKEKQDKRDKME